MSLYSRLQSVKWLHALHLWYWNWIRVPLCKRLLPTILGRIRYSRQLSRIRQAYGKRKLRVIFPVSNTSKWKCQPLFDLMQESEKFDPLVALTPMDVETEKTPDEQFEIIEKNKKFFDERGCNWVVAYDVCSRKYARFSEFFADIVWYTQPWKIDKDQKPIVAAKTALTCYVPYFVQNYGWLTMDCGQTFHRQLWRHFTLSEYWAIAFEKYLGVVRTGCVKGLGHPMLDGIRFNEKKQENACVIYAPHWSCNTSECYSTFLKNGQQILDFARAHTELKWVFKPHPSLRHNLMKINGWSQRKVDKYYAEWNKFAIVCYDGNYLKLFDESSAMITDCASFLVEYACTGKPIIHLISSNCILPPHPVAQELFSTYYQAHNWEELSNYLTRVVLSGDDYKRDERISVVKRMRLLDNHAAKNILDYLDAVFSGENE